MLSDSDEEFVEEEEEQTPAAVKKLREKLETAVKEKQEYLDGWQRARADFANFKKEEAQMMAEKEERIKADFIEALVPSLDSFEMALKHAPTEELKIVHKQLLSSLGTMGVEQFGKPGEEFNPHKHEALMQKGEGHTIETVERSGYSVGNKIIRAAQVII
ncbi:MAG: nucleotide exchange factor GrpE [Candidatus Adlerbacteria bacterium]|nr:nucleotide exchange factor GrpE [Candidatus Adlerbacteria bacterium]